MPIFLQFLVRRLFLIFISLFVITLVLYGGVMLIPADERVELYMPPGMKPDITEEQLQRIKDNLINRYHLSDPYPVQYGYWIASLFEGGWGYSPTLREPVLAALLRRTPVTAELTLYSLLLFLPLGLLAGGSGGWQRNGAGDTAFRFFAFLGTSIPPFILAVILLAIFYVNMGWFAPGRLNQSLGFVVLSTEFSAYTGLLTIDGLLNKRLDISLDAFRHLVMPVFTLSLYHWATLGRITRATIIEQRRKGYISAAIARGLSDRTVKWKHAFPNVLSPAMTSMALSAASLLTGVYVVEIIFNFRGISQVIVGAFSSVPDITAAMGFAMYSVVLVLFLMFVLDLLQAAFNPRVREEIIR
jgi:ABC-type dipeptide/oligopeptide/nickel transport system permease component